MRWEFPPAEDSFSKQKFYKSYETRSLQGKFLFSGFNLNVENFSNSQECSLLRKVLKLSSDFLPGGLSKLSTFEFFLFIVFAQAQTSLWLALRLLRDYCDYIELRLFFHFYIHSLFLNTYANVTLQLHPQLKKIGWQSAGTWLDRRNAGWDQAGTQLRLFSVLQSWRICQ